MKQTTAQKILIQLIEHADSWLSGDALATQLEISRESVWKAINTLRKQGNEIESRKNMGYRFVKNASLNAAIINYYTNQDFAGRLYVDDEVTSTQSVAKAFLSHHQVTQPTVFVANAQTEGYGRRGRAFFSPAETGLYFSMILPNPTHEWPKAGLMTTTFAVLITDVLRQFFPDQDFQYKWVNDIYLNHKKVVGILTEAVLDLESSSTAAFVVGIGMNVATQLFPNDLKAKVTSMSATPVDRNLLVSRLIETIAAHYMDYANPEYLDAYRQHAVVLGREVHLQLGDETVVGVAQQIEADGALTIKTTDGELRTFTSGEVTKVHYAGQQEDSQK
ncbi:biotin--[acetyl-CoA-carboxylase] ligase [Secundilactobacillus paracollinoides]|uniref:Bifunctional ligase/repressor BirA n=1 Tax=Secundilactobacillus paracollinoides TaxID=240427 RepID=A0A1B2IXN1_9LACO|nr:biotin--[acetyl-CoA-carboxylase] ligase [Secundilactobacillus paracollinoides]ANZ60938.1 bifunctional biotin--[acetyl-CoA-carboxylase] synthetase/biotin operon repressor [Secundilactobacillus paracollinoides]ANZ66797.1 bifunctional biotin--[acetyl-CoA-carboxylase] synthetase/biotin operon repressor [Secundilactobacillus paracollinoides]KRL80697.1 biotin--[acetyl-coa-carboxylase] ligase and biotin operon repressor [Secundilactobacillus paracollinoides DSM 15502 = JCM 11969]